MNSRKEEWKKKERIGYKNRKRKRKRKRKRDENEEGHTLYYLYEE
jgi:hypothetical protein